MEFGRQRKRTLKKPTQPQTLSYSQTECTDCGYSFCVQIKSNLSLLLSFSCFIMQNSCSSLLFSSELWIVTCKTDLKPGKKNWEINSSSPPLYTICVTLNCIHTVLFRMYNTSLGERELPDKSDRKDNLAKLLFVK